MKQIKEEVLLEKMRVNSNASRVQRLQQIVDRNAITQHEFSNLGMFMSRDAYLKNVNKNAVLLNNCTDVVYYLFNFVVQVLDSSTYHFELDDATESDEMNTQLESSNLKTVEKFMYNELTK